MCAQLTNFPGATAYEWDHIARAPRADDAEQLAVLMYTSYRGTTDDAGETLDDARGEVRKLLTDQFGLFDATRSAVYEMDGALGAATILTRWRDAPFVAFSMTAPEWKRRGLARAGLVRAMRALAADGESIVRLIVTDGNTPAESLYTSLGFVRKSSK